MPSETVVYKVAGQSSAGPDPDPVPTGVVRDSLDSAAKAHARKRSPKPACAPGAQ